METQLNAPKEGFEEVKKAAKKKKVSPMQGYEDRLREAERVQQAVAAEEDLVADLRRYDASAKGTPPPLPPPDTGASGSPLLPTSEVVGSPSGAIDSPEIPTSPIPGSAKHLSTSSMSSMADSTVLGMTLPHMPPPPPPPVEDIASKFEQQLQRSRDLEAVKAYDTRSLVSFIPNVLMQILAERERVAYEAYEFPAATCFIDVCGFTTITEAMRNSRDGSNGIATHLNAFFSLLLRIVGESGGDVVQFSGDALFAIWKHDEDLIRSAGGQTRQTFEESSKRSLMDLAAKAYGCAIAVLDATKNEHIQFTDDSDPIRLGVHISIGIGDIKFSIVGGVRDEWRYVTTGAGVKDSVDNVDLAIMDQLVLSSAIHGVLTEPVDDEDDGGGVSPKEKEEPRRKLRTIKTEAIYSAGFAGTVAEDPVAYKHVSSAADSFFFKRDATLVNAPEMVQERIVAEVQKRNEDEFKYKVKSFLFDTITNTWGEEGELRIVSTIFIHLNIMEKHRESKAQQTLPIDYLLQHVVQSVLTELGKRDGILNKVLYDDKGALLLCVFGLPGHSHEDDSLRAVDFAHDLVQKLERWRENFTHQDTSGQALNQTTSEKVTYVLPNFYASCGISRSKVYCGMCGAKQRREYTVLGDGVNTAARVMQFAMRQTSRKDGVHLSTVCCDDSTRSLCQSFNMFAFNNGQDVKMKGKKILTKVWTVEKSSGAAPHASQPTLALQPVIKAGETVGSPTTATPGVKPAGEELKIFGREKEMIVLFSAVLCIQKNAEKIIDLGDSSPAERTIVIQGDAGEGKTLLLEKIQSFAETSQGGIGASKLYLQHGFGAGQSSYYENRPAVHTAQCSPLEKNTPYYVIALLIKRLLEERTMEWLSQELDSFDNNIHLRPLLNCILPLGEQLQETEESMKLSDSERTDIMLEVIAGIFSREYTLDVAPDGTATKIQPVVLTVDNIHWCDQSSLRVLTYIVRNSPYFAVIATRRVESNDKKRGDEEEDEEDQARTLVKEEHYRDWGGVNCFDRNGPATKVVLTPLAKKDTANLLNKISGALVREDVLNVIHKKCMGNPGFSEQLFVSLCDLTTPAEEGTAKGLPEFSPVHQQNRGAAGPLLTPLPQQDATPPPTNLSTIVSHLMFGSNGVLEVTEAGAGHTTRALGERYFISFQQGVDVSKLPLPDRIEGVITGRVDRLSPQLQNLLKVASVIGSTFSLALLQDVLEKNGVAYSVSDLVHKLESLGFLVIVKSGGGLRKVGSEKSGVHSMISGGSATSLVKKVSDKILRAYEDSPVFGFRIQLMQDVLYSMLLANERRQYHRHVAEYLEQSFVAGVCIDPCILLHHFTEGDLVSRSLIYLGKTADVEYLKNNMEKALVYYQKAITIAKKMDTHDTLKPKGGAFYHWVSVSAFLLYQSGDMDGAARHADMLLKSVAGNDLLRSDLWHGKTDFNSDDTCCTIRRGGPQSKVHFCFDTRYGFEGGAHSDDKGMGLSCHLHILNMLDWKEYLKMTQARSEVYIGERNMKNANATSASSSFMNNWKLPSSQPQYSTHSLSGPAGGSAQSAYRSITVTASASNAPSSHSPAVHDKHLLMSSPPPNLRQRRTRRERHRSTPVEGAPGDHSSVLCGLTYYHGEAEEVSVVDVFLARHVLAMVHHSKGCVPLFRHHALRGLLLYEHYLTMVEKERANCQQVLSSLDRNSNTPKSNAAESIRERVFWSERLRRMETQLRSLRDGFNTVGKSKRGALVMFLHTYNPANIWYGLGSNRRRTRDDAVAAMEGAVSRYPNDSATIEKFGIVLCTYYSEPKTVQTYVSSHNQMSSDGDLATTALYYLTVDVYLCFTGARNTKKGGSSGRWGHLLELAKFANFSNNSRCEAYSVLFSIYIDVLILGGDRMERGSKLAEITRQKLKKSQKLITGDMLSHDSDRERPQPDGARLYSFGKGFSLNSCISDRQIVFLLQCISAVGMAATSVVAPPVQGEQNVGIIGGSGGDDALRFLVSAVVLLDEARQFPATFVVLVSLHAFVEAVTHASVAATTVAMSDLRHGAKKALSIMSEAVKEIPSWRPALLLMEALVALWLRQGVANGSVRSSLRSCYDHANSLNMPYFAARSLAILTTIERDTSVKKDNRRLTEELFEKVGTTPELQKHFCSGELKL